MCQLSHSAAMSEWDYTLRLGETEGVRVEAIVVSVVASLAVETIFACGAVPDSVIRLKLFAELTPMREWEGPS